MKTLESYIKSIDTKDLWKNKPIKETYKTIQHFLKWLFKKDPWTKEYTKDDWERLNSMFVYIQHKDLDANQLEDIIMNHNKPFTYCRFYTNGLRF